MKSLSESELAHLLSAYRRGGLIAAAMNFPGRHEDRLRMDIKLAEWMEREKVRKGEMEAATRLESLQEAEAAEEAAVRAGYVHNWPDQETIKAMCAKFRAKNYAKKLLER